MERGQGPALRVKRARQGRNVIRPITVYQQSRLCAIDIRYKSLCRTRTCARGTLRSSGASGSMRRLCDLPGHAVLCPAMIRRAWPHLAVLGYAGRARSHICSVRGLAGSAIAKLSDQLVRATA